MSTIRPEHVEVDHSSLASTSELACDSRSYPNLLCEYELHRLDAYVPNLPEGAFTTKEFDKGADEWNHKAAAAHCNFGDGCPLVQTVRWEWRSPSSVEVRGASETLWWETWIGDWRFDTPPYAPPYAPPDAPPYTQPYTQHCPLPCPLPPSYPPLTPYPTRTPPVPHPYPTC